MNHSVYFFSLSMVVWKICIKFAAIFMISYLEHKCSYNNTVLLKESISCIERE